MGEQMSALLSFFRDEAPEPGEAAESAPAQPRVPLPARGGQMTWQDQAHALLRHFWRQAWQRFQRARKAEGGLIHGLITARPPSVAGQADYAKSKAWVPPGHEGGLADWWGTLYQKWVGVPGTALGCIWIGIVRRPSAFLPAAAVFLAVTIPAALWLGIL